MKLFTLPNIITLLNLLCGCMAIVFAFNGNLVWAAYLVGIAAVLDFLDGFVARALKQFSPIGKDLDSLADMVTFGVVPGVVMFQMMQFCIMGQIGMNYANDAMTHLYQMNQVAPQQSGNLSVSSITDFSLLKSLPYSAFLITLFSALRLAKFNNDTRQSDSFIGVPTPANSILICSLPLIAHSYYGIFSGKMPEDFSHIGGYMAMAGMGIDPASMMPGLNSSLHYMIYFLIAITLLMSFLLISEIPLFALKVKGFGWKENKIRYIFLVIALIMLVFLKFIALPLIIVLYILMSVGNNLLKNKAE
jgi:CDP-diacylglycerol---serine O-phosphatidyltransferase